jgi:hypothetical protein
MEYYTSDTLPLHLEHYKSIFLSLGTFYASSPLTTAEGIKLAEYLDDGGNLYMEGAVTWHLDPQTQVHLRFNIGKVTVPWTNFEQLTGVQGTFTENMLFDFTGQYSMTPYYLEPLVGAFSIFMLDTSSYLSASVAHEYGPYKTIGSMVDFGSLETSDPIFNRTLLMKNMLIFFGLDDYFVGIEEVNNDFAEPGKISCYPNPFNTLTTIGFSLNETAKVNIEIYDLSGNLIYKPLQNQQLSAGSYCVQWDARDEWQQTVSPGIYIYQVRMGSKVSTGKLVKME